MTVLEELEQKIGAATTDVQRVLDKLGEQTQLETSLQDANKTLSQAAGGLATLTDTLTKIGNEFKQALGVFQEAARTIRETDPARILDGIGRIESRLESLGVAITGLSRFLEKVAPDLVAAVGKFKSDLKDEMGSIRTAIRTEFETAEAQHQIASKATASRISTLQTLVILILVMVLTILGFEFYVHVAR